MADMPSQLHPSPRPSPPSRTSRMSAEQRGRGGGAYPPQNGYAAGEGERDGRYLSPHPQGRARDSPSRSRGRFQDTTREGFSFSDDEEHKGDHGDRVRNGGAHTLSKEEDDEAGKDLGDGEEDEEGEENDDYYAILALPRNATTSQIRAAYHLLSRRLHPDKQPPEMRDRATRHFNSILVAYETLNNPRKRIVYDKLGVEGLKLNTWQLGVRSMSPEQFRYWFEENMQKQKMELLDELVGSTGKVQTLVDISGFWFSNLVRHVDEKGNLLRVEVKPYPTGRVSSYTVRHSFHVPLHAIAEVLERPLDELWKQNKEKPTQLQSNKNHRLPKPMLSFEFGINGRSVVVAGQKGSPKQKAEAKLPSQVLGGTSLAATLSHHFPHVSPEAPRSLASLMAGNQIGLTAIAFPTPMITTQIGRTFGQNAAQVQSSFFALPSKAPPLITTTFNRRLGIRHSMFIGFNTGATQWFYTSLKDLFSFPAPGKLRNGYASLGYTYHPVSAGYPEGEEGDASQQPRQRAGKSQRTETYSAVLTAGTMAGGAQVKLAWGRTFFVGTPISKATHGQKRPSVGVRLGVETTLHATGSARWLVKASRKIFDNTTVGVNISVGGASGTEGVIVGFTWTRLGQKIALPFMIAPIPHHKMAVYATVIPFFTYVVAEFLWLRPRERKLCEQEAARIWKTMKKKTFRRRKAAEDAQEVMRVSVERKMEQERSSNGLVILRATYGKQGMLADVTIALAALVDHGQLVLPSGVDKSKLIGFWDPAPGSEKLLTVSYLYGGLEHEVVVKSSHGLAAPMRSHILPGQV